MKTISIIGCVDRRNLYVWCIVYVGIESVCVVGICRQEERNRLIPAMGPGAQQRYGGTQVHTYTHGCTHILNQWLIKGRVGRWRPNRKRRRTDTVFIVNEQLVFMFSALQPSFKRSQTLHH